jgi:hypothetical protein
LEQGVCHLKPAETLTLPKHEPTLREPEPDPVDSTLVESDDDPEEEYKAAPSETSDSTPEVPVKGKRKVVKKA